MERNLGVVIRTMAVAVKAWDGPGRSRASNTAASYRRFTPNAPIPVRQANGAMFDTCSDLARSLAVVEAGTNGVAAVRLGSTGRRSLGSQKRPGN